ncbi:MAG: hypothetical protein ABR563_00575 [Pyrinomonadaceae bacterium]
MNREQRSPQAQRPKRLHLRPGDYGRKSNHPRSSIGAASGLAGVVALFVGAGLGGVAWLVGRGSAEVWLRDLGVALLLLAILLLAFGAHCFDCADRDSSTSSRAYARDKGQD